MREFRSFANKTGSKTWVQQQRAWGEFYAGRLADEGRYLTHLRETYAPFFRVALSLAVTLTHGAQYVASPTLYELGAPPCFMLQALENEMKGQVYMTLRGYGSGEHVGNLWAADNYIRPIYPTNCVPDLRKYEYRELIRRDLDYQHGGAHAPVIIATFGLLEHFTDQVVLEILDDTRTREQAAGLHYVPLEGHGKGSFGDERLLSLSHWRDLLAPDYWETFNDNKDLVMVVKQKDHWTWAVEPAQWEMREAGIITWQQ